MVALECVQWYALRTQERYEKVVRDECMFRGLLPLLPLFHRVSQWKDRSKIVEWPLFPSYCFVRLNSADLSAAVRVPGVVEILTRGGCPDPIPDEEIAVLQRLVQSCAQYRSYPYLSAGTAVTMMGGPLQGLQGKLMRNNSLSWLIISITAIQQSVACEIDPHDISPSDYIAA